MKKKLHTPSGNLLNLLSNAWTLDILDTLRSSGTMRFGAIKDNVMGISGRVLAVRLKRMEELGFVERFSHPTSPPQVDYTLTDKGKNLCNFLDEVDDRAKNLMPEKF